MGRLHLMTSWASCETWRARLWLSNRNRFVLRISGPFLCYDTYNKKVPTVIANKPFMDSLWWLNNSMPHIWTSQVDVDQWLSCHILWMPSFIWTLDSVSKWLSVCFHQFVRHIGCLQPYELLEKPFWKLKFSKMYCLAVLSCHHLPWFAMYCII
jgi:hypothetical protein